MSVLSIQERGQKIKNLLDDALRGWGIGILVLLLAVASFGLGRLSVLEDVKSPVSISEAPAQESPQGIFPGGLYEASRTGSVYYFPWCASAISIPAASRVWFASEADARAAGYHAAKNCKGLLDDAAQ